MAEGYPLVTGNASGLASVTKLTPDLDAVVYTTTLGSNMSQSTSIETDAAGGAIVGGYTSALDFPATGFF
jgi:hypothetical protein